MKYVRMIEAKLKEVYPSVVIEATADPGPKPTGNLIVQVNDTVIYDKMGGDGSWDDSKAPALLLKIHPLFN